MPTKVHLVKAMVFPVVMYGCESWTVKKAECQRIDAFELWCWRRLLRVPWTARMSNQSILKEISPGCSLEGLMLKLQYFGHLMQRVDSLEKTLMLGGIGGRRRRGQQRMRWLDGITDSMDMGLRNSRSWWWQGGLVCCSPWGFEESDMTEWLNWIELNWTSVKTQRTNSIIKGLKLCNFGDTDLGKTKKVFWVRESRWVIKANPWLLKFTGKNYDCKKGNTCP